MQIQPGSLELSHATVVGGAAPVGGLTLQVSQIHGHFEGMPMPMRTIYYKSNLFDQAGMASLLPPDPPPVVSRRDKRTLPPDIRQEIINLHAEYPAFHPHELATICFVKFGPSPPLKRSSSPSLGPTSLTCDGSVSRRFTFVMFA